MYKNNIRIFQKTKFRGILLFAFPRTRKEHFRFIPTSASCQDCVTNLRNWIFKVHLTSPNSFPHDWVPAGKRRVQGSRNRAKATGTEPKNRWNGGRERWNRGRERWNGGRELCSWLVKQGGEISHRLDILCRPTSSRSLEAFSICS